MPSETIVKPPTLDWRPPSDLKDLRKSLEAEGSNLRSQLKALRKLIQYQNQPVALFAGAGVSRMPPANQPSWGDLTDQMLIGAARLPLPPASEALNYARYLAAKGDYYGAFDTLFKNLRENDFQELVRKLTRTHDAQPNLNHEMVARAVLRCIVTTNYDGLFEAAFAKYMGQAVHSFTWTEGSVISEAHAEMVKGACPKFVFNLHGRQPGTGNIVLRSSQVSQISTRTDIKTLLQKVRDGNQLIFVGYGFHDTDAKALWEYLDVESVRFQQPALFICSVGEVDESKIKTLDTRFNIRVLEFDNSTGDYRYLPYALLAVLEETSKLPADVARRFRDDLNERMPLSALPVDQYLLVGVAADSDYINDLALFLRSLVISIIDPKDSAATHPKLTKDSIIQRVKEHLGFLSQPMLESLQKAFASLATEGILRFATDDESAIIDRKLLAELKQRAEKSKRQFENAIKIVAQRSASERGTQITETELTHLRDLSNVILREQGRGLAEAFVSHKSSALTPGFVRALVREYAREINVTDSERTGLFEDCLLRLFLGTPKEYVSVIARRLHASMLTANYILEPGKACLMRRFTQDHIVYFDSNIVLRAVAKDLPSNTEAASVIRRTAQLGMRVRIRVEMLREIVAHLDKAREVLHSLRVNGGDFGTALAEEVRAYDEVEGGNLFVASYARFRKGSLLSWQAYLQSLFSFKGRGMPEEWQIRDFLSEQFRMEVDDSTLDADWARHWDGRGLKNERNRIAMKLQSLHSDPERPKARRLAENEAMQFLIIHTLRKKLEAYDKIWFVTNDGYVNRFQLDEAEQSYYHSVVAYFQIGWQQYLSSLDYESRSRHRFTEFLESSFFGLAFTSDDIEELRKSLRNGHRVVDADTLKRIVKQLHTQWVRADVTRDDIQRAKWAADRLRGEKET